MKKKIVGILVMTLLIATALQAVGTMNEFKPLNAQIKSFQPCLLEEGFESDKFPPEGWILESENPNHTWELYSGWVHTGNNASWCSYDPSKQNESLITKKLDFNENNWISIRIEFYFNTNWEHAVKEDFIDLNLSISIDNGTTWKHIWNEDSYPQWLGFKWKKKTIDLTEYLSNSTVKIKFAYISDCENGADLGIDDILICGVPIGELDVDPHGSYKGYTYKRIYFKGDVTGAQGSIDWYWDFGDGNKSRSRNPTHKYYEQGTYDVILYVEDSIGNNGTGITEAEIEISTGKRPNILIEPKPNSIGLKTNLKNIGEDATDLIWQIQVRGIFTPWDNISIGNITEIEQGKSKPIRCNYFFGFGAFYITIIADPGYGTTQSIDCIGFKIGPGWFAVSEEE
jgi:hypothetical protein